MVADTSVLTTGRLLVATFLLPDTISFQVPARDKDGRMRSNNFKNCTTASNGRLSNSSAASSASATTTTVNSSTSPSTNTNSSSSQQQQQQSHHQAGANSTHLPAPVARPAAATVYPLAAVDTFNGGMLDQDQAPLSVPTSSSRRSTPREMVLTSSSILVPPPPTSPSFYRSATSTGEVVMNVPKLISSKADRLKDQERPTMPQRSSFHGQHATPPPSILTPPEVKVELGRVFPEAAPRPALNQPRSRTTDHLSILTHQTIPQRRSSIDSAKVFAEAAWTVEKAIGGNIGLHNAVNSIQSQLTKRIWVGTLGMATDSLPDSTRGDIKAELALNHSSIPVFVNDLDFEGHYHQYCKQVNIGYKKKGERGIFFSFLSFYYPLSYGGLKVHFREKKNNAMSWFEDWIGYWAMLWSGNPSANKQQNLRKHTLFKKVDQSHVHSLSLSARFSAPFLLPFLMSYEAIGW
jgi:trehalose 6-phosphate synthase/phosphatase